MQKKQPFDFTDMMAMFDPAKVSAMFDPKQFGAAFGTTNPPAFDMNAIMQSNQRNYESMVAANKAAAAVYKSFYEKQMAIYQEVMAEATNQIQALQSQGAPDTKEQQSKIYNDAVQRALQLMTDLATASTQANEEAFAIVKDRVAQAVSELKSK